MYNVLDRSSGSSVNGDISWRITLFYGPHERLKFYRSQGYTIEDVGY